MNHKQKKRKANQLRSQREQSTYIIVDNVMRRKLPTPIFQSFKWMQMRAAKELRVMKQFNRAQLRRTSGVEVLEGSFEDDSS